MPVNIKGKEYKTVAERVTEFRGDHADWSIITDIIKADDSSVIAKTEIREGNNVVSTGWAEEMRGANSFVKNCEVELAETSAVGRALAFFKYAGHEIASADEVAGAIKAEAGAEHIEYITAVRDEWPTIAAVKDFLAEEVPNVDAAREAFKELTEDMQRFLWKAPTKGGIFTIMERKLLKEGKA